MGDPDIPFLSLFHMGPHDKHVEALIFHAKWKKPGVGRGIGRLQGVGMLSKAQHPQALVGILPHPMSKWGPALFDMPLGTFLQQDHIWVQREDVFLLGGIRHVAVPRNNSHADDSSGVHRKQSLHVTEWREAAHTCTQPVRVSAASLRAGTEAGVTSGKRKRK